eukprot:TRINITY_DN11758_c0_g1_i2.p1 TRINITY_DN11758_c0_g1~~TRINITY_DN11758_c0_g1_i2.p1  ORF type:complete len:316 (+),score=55.05 TRINITY_DN11758_c0_g1_i2:34-948(+)
MIRRPPRSTPLYSSAASDVYKRQNLGSSRSTTSLATRANYTAKYDSNLKENVRKPLSPNINNCTLDFTNPKGVSCTNLFTPYSLSQVKDLIKDTRRGSKESDKSFMHYTNNAAQQNLLTTQMKALIRYNSSIELKHPGAGTIEECRNVVSPFGKYMNRGCDKAKLGRLNGGKCEAERSMCKSSQGRTEKLRSYQQSFERSVLRSFTPHMKTKEECSSSRIKKMQENFLNRLIKITASSKDLPTTQSSHISQNKLLFLSSIPNNLQHNIMKVRKGIIGKSPGEKNSRITNSVSYTHLTLPTNREV